MSNQTSPPVRSSVSAAAEAVQHAEEVLDGALFAGVDTTSARSSLAAAREALAAERAAAAETASAAAAEHAAVAQQAESAAIVAAQEQVAEAIETIESAPGAEPLPEPPAPPPMVRLAAQESARARAALAKAQAPHAEAVKARDALRARMQPKQAELDAIRARRTAGIEQPADAAAMNALAMDLEDLGRMMKPMEDAVIATEPAAQQQAVVAAEAALAKAKVSAELDGLADRVRALEQHFVAQVRTLRLEAQKRNCNNLGSIYIASDLLRKVAHGAWL
ncbi:hypothetical protein [Variovorax sp. RA8]|uniref:hypothetical protein n=1 Tax=Variovorax sp. (strain JCM 16519 / RA8) TaxID=662548 RepID=UPI0013161CEA|nr:hypothetical protein [Variovorax sp. RA8]VTU14356.1 hypothetical protein RA8CHR_00550 [Variovorax sp. RA8]